MKKITLILAIVLFSCNSICAQSLPASIVISILEEIGGAIKDNNVKSSKNVFTSFGTSAYYSKALLNKENFSLYNWQSVLSDRERLNVIVVDTLSSSNAAICKINLVDIIKGKSQKNYGKADYEQQFNAIDSKKSLKIKSGFFVNLETIKGILTVEYTNDVIIMAYLPFKGDNYRSSFKVDDIEILLNSATYINYDKMQMDVLFHDAVAIADLKVVPQDYKTKLINALAGAAQNETKSKASVIDTVNFSEAKFKDPEIEAEIVKATKISKEFIGAEVKKTNLMSDWRVVYHEKTGVILGRRRDALIGYVKNGRCFKGLYVFQQDYDGTGYQKNMRFTGFMSAVRELNCNKLSQ